MGPAALVITQIELEYDVNHEGLLVPFPGSSEEARFIIYRHDGGYSRFFRHDLPAVVKRQIGNVAADEAVGGSDAASRILGSTEPFVGRTYTWGESVPGADWCPSVVRKDGHVEVEVEGQVGARAWSVRENGVAAEAAVETLPAFRRRGLASHTVRAWAADIMTKGKVAFFSHAENNVASRGLAQALNLTELARFAAYG